MLTIPVHNTTTCLKRFNFVFFSFKIIRRPAWSVFLCLEWFSGECRQTKTKVITLANHKEHTQYSEPIKTQSNYTGADPGEVKWVNFHPPFSEPPSFFSFSYPSDIEIIFDFSDIITKNHPPFQNPGSALVTGSWRKAWENMCEWVAIGFGFASDWMKNWHEFCKPIA